ncbi:YggS family pyridoxal phosphate-dependent enzyme [Gracilibacillus marinus]|uniref:Pyridoxal phosphate homeostasis protein n=1 Tax=Gracilibacillus marinus TaxID=630535 RepID=A0ABV8VTT3_9BACI
MTVAENLVNIQNNIRKACEKANRKIEDITIIGVTKYVSIERTIEAIDSGVKHIGENRPEGLLSKKESIANEAIWHFIGTLQSRKVKDVIDHVDYIHSLDRMSLAKEINKRQEKKINCFVQVNTSGEQSKHGLNEEEVHAFIQQLKEYPSIHVVGLMTMAPHVTDETVLRTTFRKLKLLKEEIEEQQYSHAPCQYLSMGMSNDYMIAIEEGATHIRIGSELVGPYEE